MIEAMMDVKRLGGDAWCIRADGLAFGVAGVAAEARSRWEAPRAGLSQILRSSKEGSRRSEKGDKL